MVSRNIFDHELVGVHNPKNFAAWVWMLGKARYRDGGGLKRGQLRTSVRELSRKFKFSKDGATRFLAGLKQDAMADTYKDTKGTIVTIRNYSKYQNFRKGGGEEERGSKDTRKDTSPDANRTQQGTRHTLLPASQETSTSTNFPPNGGKLVSTRENTPTQKGAKKMAKSKLDKIEKKHAEFLEAGKTRAKNTEFVYLTRRDRELVKAYWLGKGMDAQALLDGVQMLDGHFANNPRSFLEKVSHRACLNGWVFTAVAEQQTALARKQTSESNFKNAQGRKTNNQIARELHDKELRIKHGQGRNSGHDALPLGDVAEVRGQRGRNSRLDGGVYRSNGRGDAHSHSGVREVVQRAVGAVGIGTSSTASPPGSSQASDSGTRAARSSREPLARRTSAEKSEIQGVTNGGGVRVATTDQVGVLSEQEARSRKKRLLEQAKHISTEKCSSRDAEAL